ncbi:MAG: 50S ribosomal protein L23 [Cytophagales bacterium]|nr:50S ribosomal protein L23 [Cytophagales bacterium]MDW8384364.1 50S ribosomal protein L23 [Flammeovirgaceae bacterium]
MKEIIIKPITTEKNTKKQAQGIYAFQVAIDADKPTIKKAIEEKFNVKVVSVNTLRVLGKKKTRYTKRNVMIGRKPSYKKAYVRVAEGQFIDIYGGNVS